MKIQAVKTHRVHAAEDLESILDQFIPFLSEKTVVCITSKIVSLCQNQVVQKTVCSKDDLIHQEADLIVKASHNPYSIYLTIKNNILIPSAGIDESNGEGIYILYPKDIQPTAISIWHHLRKRHQVKQLGVLITDSHTTPMRQGVTGIALGWCGFQPLYSYVGQPDLYGKPLRVTQINVLDALATSAVFLMGEGNEGTPLVLIEEPPSRVVFMDRAPNPQEEKSIVISMEDDMYAPLLTGASWFKPGKEEKSHSQEV